MSLDNERVNLLSFAQGVDQINQGLPQGKTPEGRVFLAAGALCRRYNQELNGLAPGQDPSVLAREIAAQAILPVTLQVDVCTT